MLAMFPSIPTWLLQFLYRRPCVQTKITSCCNIKCTFCLPLLPPPPPPPLHASRGGLFRLTDSTPKSLRRSISSGAAPPPPLRFFPFLPVRRRRAAPNNYKHPWLVTKARPRRVCCSRLEGGGGSFRPGGVIEFHVRPSSLDVEGAAAPETD